MGEIADAIINGELCEGCGGYVPGTPPGYPRYCSNACKPARTVKPNPNLLLKKCKCPMCGKRVKEVGLKDHMRDAHGE